MSAPSRAFVLRVEIGGDSWPDVVAQLRNLERGALDLSPDRPPSQSGAFSIGGGYSTGHVVEVAVDPEMTNARYFAALEAHLAAEREAEAATGGER